jgi:Lipase maturation factor
MFARRRDDTAQSSEHELERSLHEGWFGGAKPRYWLARMLLLRALGFIYAVAFLVLVQQWRGLIGSGGILPAADFLARIRAHTPFAQWPTLFWLDASDSAVGTLAALGLLLSLAVLLGVDHAAILLALWALYLSFCHVGQIFWGYGWEILLLEAGFLAVFLAPVRSPSTLRSAGPPPATVIWLLRWLLFRVMFGAGLIKLRGDPCWTELSCLDHHYETQPLPSPLSWLLHQAPAWFHRSGVLFNHAVELVAPFLVLGPRRARHLGGVLIAAFQLMLIASGNLSFLNWLTLAVCIACFDDAALERVLPARLISRAHTLEQRKSDSRARTVACALLAIGVGVLSIGPIENMLSPRQAMNTSFDPLHLVNTYGAFGSVSTVRHEVILQGTRATQLSDTTRWLEYEFPCKPGDVRRRPCLITPYHYRLDWQMWFAGLGDATQQPWFRGLVNKLLRAEPSVRALLARDPFGNTPPRYIRAELYEYRFTRIGDGRDAWWTRKRVGPYLHPATLE